MEAKDYVRRDVCDVLMQRDREERQTLRERVQKHGAEIDEIREVVNRQTTTLEGITERLESVDARLKQMEDKPRKRWEGLVGTIINWATLAVLAMLAAKIGL